MLNKGLLRPEPPATSKIMKTVGFINMWQQFDHYSNAKQLLAVNATLQVRDRRQKDVSSLCNRTAVHGRQQGAAPGHRCAWRLTRKR